MTTVTPSTVSTRLKILYGVADIGLAVLQAAVQFFLLFYYTDVARVNPAVAGTALLVSKLTWDAINDPLFGYLSDRTRSRWGRRRPYMLFAAVPMGLAFWLMFSLPQGLSDGLAFLGVMATFLLFDTFHTMISMAYYAVTAEMSTDYDERTSITAVRMIFSIIGYILGAAITTVVVGLLGDLMGLGKAGSWSGMGLVFGSIAAAVVLLTGTTVRYRPVVNVEPTQMAPISAVFQALRNQPFVRLIASCAIANLSFTLITSLLPYYLIYQLDMEAQLPIVMLLLLVTIAIFLFPTKMLSDRINKGPAFAAGLGLASLAILCTFFLPQGTTPIIYLIAVVAGVSFAGQWVFPGSMVPDVVELDEKETGERREGVYFGIWAFVGKLTGALGIAISGWALELFGYVEGVAQSARALLGIRLFFGLVPAVVILLSLPLLIWYPITKQTHARLLAELQSDPGE